jgi:phosphatidylglycerophosphatase A
VRRLAVLLATGFGIGRLPVAPATWASAAVTLCLVPDAARAPLPLGLAILLLLPVSIVVCQLAEHDLGTDAHPIVADEVVGMLIAVWGVPHQAGTSPFLLLVLAFLFFRAYDIVKPTPIRQSQSLPGGWGVVTDDVLAGIATNLTLRLGVTLGLPL